jgi:hypothetical protein
MSLHERVAAHLGWTVPDTQSFSLRSLLELVRDNPKLTLLLTDEIEKGVSVAREES